MYERRHAPLLPRKAFIGRVLLHAVACLVLLTISLAVGMLGYVITEHMAAIDAYLMAAMILTGMGPTTELHTTAGKLFAGGYALYSGIIFLIIFGVMATPVFHRMLHAFHVEEVPDPSVHRNLPKDSAAPHPTPSGKASHS
jgi:hypothetical protein